MCHHDGRPRIADQELEALEGIGGIERQVDASRLQHGPERHHQVHRALDEHADWGLGGNAQRPQPARQAIGPRVQLAVAHAHALTGQRQRVSLTRRA